MVVEQFVFNTAGKLDRKALPAPDFTTLLAEYVAPVGETQEQIAAVFAEVLGLDLLRSAQTPRFFDLGGNSLSATRVAARVGEALAAEVSVRDVFEAPTVRELVRGRQCWQCGEVAGDCAG